MTGLVVVAVLLFVVFLVGVLSVLARLITHCKPDEVLVFSGSRIRYQDGSVRCYKLFTDGRHVRIPFLERVDRLSLSNMAISIDICDAFSKEMARVPLTGEADIRIGSEEPRIHHAVERFLGADREEIAQVAQDLLEATVHGVVASLPREFILSDRTDLAELVVAESEYDFDRLGLEIESLNLSARC